MILRRVQIGTLIATFLHNERKIITRVRGRYEIETISTSIIRNNSDLQRKMGEETIHTRGKLEFNSATYPYSSRFDSIGLIFNFPGRINCGDNGRLGLLEKFVGRER